MMDFTDKPKDNSDKRSWEEMVKEIERLVDKHGWRMPKFIKKEEIPVKENDSD